MQRQLNARAGTSVLGLQDANAHAAGSGQGLTMPGSSKRSGLSEGQADFVLFLLIIPEKEGGVNIRTPCLPASFCAILRKRRRLPAWP